VVAAPPAPPAAPPASASPSASPAALAAEDERLTFDVKVEHWHHHAGFPGLVMLAVDTLGTSTEQEASLDKTRADFDAKLKGIREANSAVGIVLADGVMAGAIDKAKAAAAVARVVAAASNGHATDAELDELHAALRPEQRAALVDKVEAEWTLWKDANAMDQVSDNTRPSGRLMRFAKSFELTDEQVRKARAAMEAMKPAKEALDVTASDAYVKAFSAAFVDEKFDAAKLPMTAAENAQLVSWGESCTARFYEAIAPTLTPEQRKIVADDLRHHANEAQPEGTL